ncbi:MAG TPA: nucleoside recognition protein [Bacteroidetes bacterium]|nr:nucleoside recognition protein [Bacteroidota bacterium]
MLNYVWIFLISVSIIVGAINGKLQAVTEAAFKYAGVAVDIAIGLIGVMALWLGIMRIAEKAGLVRLLARALRPVMTRLFPGVPADHPAMGAMILNISANWLGLSNAATPLGLKAMEELQKINPNKDIATDDMVVFLGLNTGSITLIPATILAVRVQMGSAAPWEIIGTTIFASTCASITAVIFAKLFQRMPVFKIKTKNNDTEITNNEEK